MDKNENNSQNFDRNAIYTFSHLGSGSQEFRKKVRELPSDPRPGAEAELTYNIFRTGTFEHPFYGENLEFDEAYLTSIKENFEAGVVPEALALNVGHRADGNGGAQGHISGLRLKKGKIQTPVGERERLFLRADVIYNSQGIVNVKDRRYLFSSAEISPDYTTREKYEVDSDELKNARVNKDDNDESSSYATISHGPTLTGLALTNKPFISNLGQVADTDKDEEFNQEQSFSQTPYREKDEGKEFYGEDIKLFTFSSPSKLKNNLEDDNKDVSSEDGSVEGEVSNGQNQNEQKDNEKEEDIQENSSEQEQVFQDPPESKNVKESNKSKKSKEKGMKLSELLSNLDDLELSEQVDKLDSNIEEFEGSDKTVVKNLLASKREALEAKEAQKKFSQKAERRKSELEKAREEKIELEQSLVSAQQGTQEAKVESFCKKLEENGHKQSTVNRVEETLLGLSTETYNEDYELVFADDEDDREMSFHEMLDYIFETVESGPVSEEFSTQESPDATVDEEETEVSPDADVEEKEEEEESATSNPFSEPSGEEEFDGEVPKKVEKFKNKYGMTPSPEEYAAIKPNGEFDIEKLNEIRGKE